MSSTALSAVALGCLQGEVIGKHSGLCEMAFKPDDYGGVLLVRDESLGELSASDSEAVGLVSFREKKWLRVIVSDECRKTLSVPLGRFSVTLEKYAARLAYKAKESDGLVAGVKRNTGTQEHESQQELLWRDWPKVYGASSFARRGKSVYIELDQVTTLCKRSRKRARLETPAYVYLLLTAVSPVIVSKTKPPYFFASCVRSSSPGEETGQDGTLSHICFQGQTAAEWFPLLQPGDALVIQDPEFNSDRDLYVVNEGTSVSRWVASESERVVAGTTVQVYEGCITRRIGSFVFELDGVPHLKLWCSHVPALGGGRGLRPGARVKIFNPSELVVNGRFEGLVLTFQSSFQITHFSPEPHATCFQFSLTLQRLLGRVTARAAFWLLKGLTIVGHVVDLKCAIEALRDQLMLDKATKSALDNFQLHRDIQSEFLHAETKWLLPADEKNELPELVSVRHLNHVIRKKLQARGLSRPQGADPRVCSLHTHGTSAWGAKFSCVDLFPHLARVQIVGLAVMTEEGQLCLRDSTGSVALSGAEKIVRSVLLQAPTVSRGLSLSSFTVYVEALTSNGLPEKVVLRDKRQGGRVGHFSLQQDEEEEGEIDCALIRYFVRATGACAAFSANKPPPAKTGSSTLSSSLPGRDALVVGLSKDSMRVVLVDAGNECSVHFADPKPYLECFREGDFCELIAPSSDDPEALKCKGCALADPKEGLELQRKGSPAYPLSVLDLYPSANQGLTKLRKKKLSFVGVVQSVSLKTNGQASSLLSLAIRCESGLQSVLCYINQYEERLLPMGLISVGVRVQVNNCQVVLEPAVGVYCESTGDTSFRVLGFHSDPHHREQQNALTAAPASSLDSLDLVLSQGIENPKAVHFARIRFGLVEIRKAHFCKLCGCCGTKLDSNNVCSASGCARRKTPFQVKATLHCAIEDGSGQGKLVASGEHAVALLGDKAWQTIYKLLGHFTDSEVSFCPKSVTTAESLSKQVFPSPQVRLEDILIIVQSSKLRQWRAVVKFHPKNVFCAGRPERKLLSLSRDVKVETGFIPKFEMVPLCLQPERASLESIL